jgi:hypothetical protein
LTPLAVKQVKKQKAFRLKEPKSSKAFNLQQLIAEMPLFNL